MEHDIVAIGASAGGVEVLLRMAEELPADLRASIFVVVHTPAGFDSPLPEVLSQRGALPATHPLHDEPIERGHIYVAPSDNHLILRPGSMQVVRGPKENGHRPAADALFRSAAVAYGPRVIAVVLSGYQDCGTAGMLSVKARGGLCVVQAPESARVNEMPLSALDRVAIDHVVKPGDLAALLTRLVSTPASAPREPDELTRQLEGVVPGEPAELVCPLCSGVLTVTHAQAFEHFRCHVGHTFSLSALVREQGEAVERALWAAVRSLEESAALSRRLSGMGRGELPARFAEKARTHLQQAELIRQLLLQGVALPDTRAN
jgi:two-component system, chemotaxis family, protein-glutamate methylesterase/glutaminase